MSGQTWTIIPNADDATAAAVFASDRLWNGYSLCDLEPPLRRYTEVWLARTPDAPPAAAVLILRHPEFTALVPHGDPDGIGAILAQHDQRPDTPFILAQPEHLSAIERWYTFTGPPTHMQRMALAANTFHAPATRLHEIVQLTIDDLAALRALYAAYPANAFTADQLRYGRFYGVRDGSAIVAAGGTHALGPRASIAAVGNIFVQPQVRGRGYGQAITALIVNDLLHEKYRDVILNVAVANDPAIRIYEALGFRAHCRYWEGAGRDGRG